VRTWIVIFGAGLVSLLIRASFLVSPLRLSDLSARTRTMLAMIPAAALGALAAPALLSIDGVLRFDLARILAAMAAMFVAWRWRSIVLTIMAGVIAIVVLDPLFVWLRA
jgi:branched-subunit amino acid transport protein